MNKNYPSSINQMKEKVLFPNQLHIEWIISVQEKKTGVGSLRKRRLKNGAPITRAMAHTNCLRRKCSWRYFRKRWVVECQSGREAYSAHICQSGRVEEYQSGTNASTQIYMPKWQSTRVPKWHICQSSRVGQLAHMPVPLAHATGGSWPEGKIHTFKNINTKYKIHNLKYQTPTYVCASGAW